MFGDVLEEPITDAAECRGKVLSRLKAAGAIRSFINARSLHLECVKVLYCSCLSFIWH